MSRLVGDPLLAAAGLDRLTHRADVVLITGASYRAQRPARPEQQAPIDPADLS